MVRRARGVGAAAGRLRDMMPSLEIAASAACVRMYSDKRQCVVGRASEEASIDNGCVLWVWVLCGLCALCCKALIDGDPRAGESGVRIGRRGRGARRPRGA